MKKTKYIAPEILSRRITVKLSVMETTAGAEGEDYTDVNTENDPYGAKMDGGFNDDGFSTSFE